VIRINANDPQTTPETLLKVCRFMIKYWKKFNKDILIDMIGYRLHGHNEVDEPMFTQPQMYQKIQDLPNTLARSYAESLI
jgi:2-oxoglutarate dehydrogenase E1 component